MKKVRITYYINNGFLLTLPVLIWDIAVAPMLPMPFQPAFFTDVPPVLLYTENILRAVVLLLALLMPFSFTTRRQMAGVVLYIAGLLVYMGSWLVLIFGRPEWSGKVFVFLAPAYTPSVWLSGIGMMGESFYFSMPFRRWFFIAASLLFLVFHNLHTFIIFNKYIDL